MLRAIVKRADEVPGLAGLCAGFESGEWRYDQLAEHIVEWLPEFALNDREFGALNGVNARRALRAAADIVYRSSKYATRGEVGEILLHAIIRQEFGSVPAISKIFFKDSPNDTVKGFDAVHVVEVADGLELWLGEVKLYQDVASAVRDVVAELHLHTAVPYLRSEFAAIWRKVDPDHPHHDALQRLLAGTASMDDVFKRLCIPVLLTYNSRTLAEHTKTDAAYEAAIIAEFEHHHQRFSSSTLPAEIRIILILLPMNNKAKLLERFDAKLKGMTI
ncbi:MAG: HamA C-terminal domain-containing protein [Janthinobacterium lividum]